MGQSTGVNVPTEGTIPSHGVEKCPTHRAQCVLYEGMGTWSSTKKVSLLAEPPSLRYKVPLSSVFPQPLPVKKLLGPLLTSTARCGS